MFLIGATLRRANLRNAGLSNQKLKRTKTISSWTWNA